MTPADRERMRDRLRAAVARARLPGAELTHPGRFEPPPMADEDLLARFEREFTTLGGVTHSATTGEDVADIVAQIAAGEPSRTVLAWDEAHLPIPGLYTAMSARGLRVLTQSPDRATSEPHRREMAAAAVGLTGADAALAQTGSIVVASAPGKGRLASLLPRVHVALVRRSLVAESLPGLIAARPDLVTLGANFVCITGPSRTADIEHVLARGVHGPGEIHAVLVP